MSLTKVVPYFRTVMNALGHKEWTDALDDTNIPMTILHRAYHLLPGASSPIKQNQDLIEVNQPVSVKLYVKGYKNTALGRDMAMQYKEEVIRKSLEDARRCQAYEGVKNVTYAGGTITELSTDNNNTIRVTMDFNCFIIMAS